MLSFLLQCKIIDSHFQFLRCRDGSLEMKLFSDMKSRIFLFFFHLSNKKKHKITFRALIQLAR